MNGSASGPSVGGPPITSYSWLVGGNTQYTGSVKNVTLASPTTVDLTVTDAGGGSAESSGEIDIIPDDPCGGPWDCGDPGAGEMHATQESETITTTEISNPPPNGPWHMTCYYTDTFDVTIYHIQGDPVVANVTYVSHELDYCVSW
jgi:hypothetical protein